MQLRRDFLIGLGILLFLNLLLALGTIGLLTRMSPAIREIIEENVVSLEAAEVMLSVLASSDEEGEEYSVQSRQKFRDSLERARRNVTEEAETPVLHRIEALSASAFQGDRRALSEIERLIVQLAEINRKAMVRADAEARRLGIAGAWIAVVFGLASLIIGLIVINRLDSRLVQPLIELDHVVTALNSGDQHRRFTLARAPSEIRRMFDRLNQFFDKMSRLNEERNSEVPERNRELERIGLLHFLESMGRPALIVADKGDILASNHEALLKLSDPEGPDFHNDLAQLSNGQEAPDYLEVTSLEGKGWLCVEKPKLR